MMHDFINEYANLNTFVGMIVGLSGFLVGLYNWNKKREITSLRDYQIFDLLKICKESVDIVRGDKATTSEIRLSVKHTHDQLLAYIQMLKNPSAVDLDALIKNKSITREDKEELMKTWKHR